jgi:hypothetical protein
LSALDGSYLGLLQFFLNQRPLTAASWISRFASQASFRPSHQDKPRNREHYSSPQARLTRLRERQ